MEPDPVRQLSQELFGQIRGSCTQLASLAQAPSLNTGPLVHELRQIHTTLAAHRRQYSDYAISPKLADYIFFPVSEVLKHDELPSVAVQYVLQILAYLNETSQFAADEASLDQILPLVIFLIRNEDKKKKQEDLQFSSAAAECLLATLKKVPTTYFKNEPKRLSFLGDTTNLLLLLLNALGSQEDMARSILDTVPWLYGTRVSADRTSLVFPGIVSKVINFHSNSRNLHTDTLVSIVALLSAFAVKVFSQRDLQVTVKSPENEFSRLMSEASAKESSGVGSSKDSLVVETIQESTSESSVNERIDSSDSSMDSQLMALTVTKTHENRTSSWLRATAQQFKLSVLVFMKNLILKPAGMNKIRTNPKLGDAIVEFTRDICLHCFEPLFNDLVLTNLDILSALCYVQYGSSDDSAFLEKIASIYTMVPRSNLRMLHRHLVFKTEAMASSQLPKALVTLNETKIGLCAAGLRVHMQVLVSVSEALMCREPIDGVAKLVVQNMAYFLQQNGTSKKQKNVARTQAAQNALDGIELPPHIDARKLGTVSPKEPTMVPVSGRAVSHVDVALDNIDLVRPFSAFLSAESESCLRATLGFIGRHASNIEDLSTMLLENPNMPSHAVSLWVANQMAEASRDEAFDIDDFLDLGEKSENADELSYLLLSHAQDVLFSRDSHNKNDQTEMETSYAIALETLSLVAVRLKKDEFQSDVLMDHLFPLLEALTYTPHSIVHQQAKRSLSQIVQEHYNSSLPALISENSDYLIDSMSSQLSVSSGLTPSLPGILLVVLKISGIELLMSNQLQDVLSQIFIIIDSYHGYSVLVENFFYVFEEIVDKTVEMYKREISDSHKIGSVRPYKPWGLRSRTEMLSMMDDSNRIVDPFEYDQEKEYFKNPGVPFGKADSDDEDENEAEHEEENGNDENRWICAIPQNVYRLIQQIFTYGLQLLSHPSVKLRVQVLKTLKKSYALMATNYSSLMPLLAQYWPLLLVLSTGVKSLSEHESMESSGDSRTSLEEPALQLMISVFEEDAVHENFMASRFTDMWKFMKGKQVRPSATLGRLLVQGISNYGRSIPDLLCHEMAKFCASVGVTSEPIQNHLYVLRTQDSGQPKLSSSPRLSSSLQVSEPRASIC